MRLKGVDKWAYRANVDALCVNMLHILAPMLATIAGMHAGVNVPDSDLIL